MTKNIILSTKFQQPLLTPLTPFLHLVPQKMLLIWSLKPILNASLHSISIIITLGQLTTTILLQTCFRYYPSLQYIFHIATKVIYLKSVMFKCFIHSKALRILQALPMSPSNSLSPVPVIPHAPTTLNFLRFLEQAQCVPISALAGTPFSLISHSSTFIQQNLWSLSHELSLLKALRLQEWKWQTQPFHKPYILASDILRTCTSSS